MRHIHIDPRRMRETRGFTLIELMTVVVILGVLATVAVGAYTKQVRNAHKAEVLSDMANIILRQKSFQAVSGHYASTTADETPYPAKSVITAAGSNATNPVEMRWTVGDAGYTASGATGAHFRGGHNLHGFDAIGFMPEGGNSYCGYGTVSGHGTNAPSPDNDVPNGGLAIAAAVFPTPNTLPYVARDWFYAFAMCDFDHDGTFWAFTTTHYTSEVASDSIGTTYKENE